MFSYVIHNPNNLLINSDCHVIPFGHRCGTALACKYANIRKFSLPFDWTNPALPKKIQATLENNFDNFIPNVHNGIFINKYGYDLSHFNQNINSGIEEYKRRIIRFNEIINQTKKIYFIYFNEDYLYDNDYRKDEFNDKTFNDMLDLEQFIKNKYTNIDYKILYFNFKRHNIPEDSNIMNIVLSSDNYYDSEHNAPYEDLRRYCGQILTELFKTQLTTGYDNNTFND